jgi:hypothetical protein
MHDKVPALAAHLGLVGEELFAQLRGALHVELSEADALVLQIFATRRASNACPDFETLPQTLFYDKTSDETAGSGDENVHCFCSFSAAKVKKKSQFLSLNSYFLRTFAPELLNIICYEEIYHYLPYGILYGGQRSAKV